jgi:hypothetical protein
MLDGTEYFDCICHSPEHTLRFVLDLDTDDPIIYTEIFLNQYRPWYKRIWVAIKYIFGYKCKYGHWDSWELKIEDAKRLAQMLISYQIAHDESIRNLKLP